ncbi:MAG: type II toxin-antitoxin system HicA family toxin [archaeon]
MKLPIISGKSLIKFLSKQGFEIAGRKGSHVRLKKKTQGKALVTVVPLHKRLDPGTLLAILRQCEISKEEFAKEESK